MKAEDIRQGKRARDEKKMQQEQINQENRPKIQENQKQQKSFRRLTSVTERRRL